MRKIHQKSTGLIRCLSFFMCCVCLTGTPVQAQFQSGGRDSSTLSLLFAGDMMGHGPQIQAARIDSNGTYNYDTCFYLIRPYIQQADLAIANLEVTLAGPPYSGYPHFSSPDAYPAALKKAGFSVLVTANNHAADRGGDGIRRTLSVLDSLGILHTGTFTDSARRDSLYPLLITVKGFRLALLNYSYGTNGLPVPAPTIVNLIDTLQMLRDLQIAQLLQPDMIISFMHWGNEYERFPSVQQKKIAHFLFRHGCDLVIGSHPHVIQPAEEDFPDSSDSAHLQLVIYSLGNAISNQRDRYKNGGIFFSVTLHKQDSLTTIKNFAYLPVWVYLKRSPGAKSAYYMVPPYALDSDKIEMTEDAKKGMQEFLIDTRKHLKGLKELPAPVQ